MSLPKEQSQRRPGRKKSGTTLRISLNLAAMPPEERVLAEKDAREGAVIGLWRAGRLSTREASIALGLGYHDYIELLGKKNIAVLDGELNEGEVDDLVRDIRTSQG